jgi:hypothetical protein
MLCQDVLKRMRGYVGGTLTPGERQDFEVHLATCDSCRAEHKRALSEDSSGLVDILELAASEKSTRVQTGKHAVAGRTPVGGTKPLGESSRRSVIQRAPTPANGESRATTLTGSGRNGTVGGATLSGSTVTGRSPTPAMGTPVVPSVGTSQSLPSMALPSALPSTRSKSPLPFVIGGLCVAGGVAAVLLLGGEKPKPAPAPAPVVAKSAELPPEPPKPAEPAKVEVKEDKQPEVAKPEVAKAAVRDSAKSERAAEKADKRAEAKDDKARAKAEAKEKAADPLLVEAKPEKAKEPPKDDKPKTEAASLASAAVNKEKSEKGKRDELGAVLSGGASKEEAAKTEENIPEKLTQSDIKKGMGPVQKKAMECYEKYNVAGTANVKLTVEPSGKISSAALAGSYDNTPTGTCILDAVKKASFPKTKSPLSFSYPFMLR